MKRGDLDARVHIDSNDEFQDIGNGMNQMAENLNKYVQKHTLRKSDREMQNWKH